MTDKTNTGERAVGNVVAGEATRRERGMLEGIRTAIDGIGTSGAVEAAAGIREAASDIGTSFSKVKKTWRDWMDPESPQPETLLTRGELLEQIRANGVEISERTLQLWEAAGIMPGPIRHWHDGAVRALYAPWVVDIADTANLGRSMGYSLEEIALRMQGAMEGAARYAIHRHGIWETDAMQKHLPAVLSELADHYQHNHNERPDIAELRFRRADGQTLSIYSITIPGHPT